MNFKYNIKPLKYVIKNIKRNKKKISLIVKTNKNSFLYIKQSYNKNWQCLINEKKTEIIPVNYLFMAIPLNKGTHKINLYFNNPYKTTLKISFITFILILIYVCFYNSNRWKKS